MCHSPVLEIFPPDWPYIHVNIEYKSIETCKKKKTWNWTSRYEFCIFKLKKSTLYDCKAVLA